MLKLIRLLAGNNIAVLHAPLALSVAIPCVQAASCFSIYFLLRAFLDNDASFPLGEITALSLVLVLLCLAYYILVRAHAQRSMIGSYRIVADIRSRVCDHLRGLPLAFFRKNDPSILSGVLLRNTADAEALFGLYIYEMTACFIVPVVLGLIMAFVDWRIALSLFCMIVVTAPIIMACSRTALNDSPAYVDAVAKLDATLLDYLRGIGELKSAGRTGTAFTPYAESNDHFLTVALRMEARFNLLSQLFLGALDCIFIVGLIVGAALLINGTMHVAVFIFFLLVVYRIIDPLQTLGCFLTVFRFAVASVKRITDILQEEALPVQTGKTLPSDNSVEFASVSFAYGEKDVLSGISFTVPEGGIAALVGESGGGKTTVSNLLLRFWDVKTGAIRIGGVDIRTLSPEDLYARFSVVFQDVYLFNDTVMNNIRLARPGASEEDVLQASRLACCHEFIMSLEKGYDTLVGERGSRLSGGERQRIAIARAILKNAPILILDEATASVDPENELLIQQGLSNLTRGKTLLVIAHRLSTIRRANQILVLKDGRIAERGTHDQLLSGNGLYRSMWKHQETLKTWRIATSGNF